MHRVPDRARCALRLLGPQAFGGLDVSDIEKATLRVVASSSEPLLGGERMRPASETGQTLDSCSGAESTGPPPDVTSILDPPTTPGELGRLANYRVLKVLGQGGMGVVFRAEDADLQRLVALKVILPEHASNSMARDRFLREARNCARLKNEHIVTVYQVGQVRDIPFLAMELLDGRPLDEPTGDDGPLPFAEVLRIGKEVAEGLMAAHDCGIIHRDIKPANIWLEAPDGRVKLLDFGLARMIGTRSDLTRLGGIVGTPEFMSPEQARGEELDPRSDLFSLGAVLYTLCSGQKPFRGDSVMAVLTALAVSTPRPLQELRPDIPPALSDLVSRLLDKDRNRRPGSAREVCQALEAIASADALPAVAPSVSLTLLDRAAERPLPRYPRAARFASAAALVVAAAVAAVWFFTRASESAANRAAAPTGPPIRIGVLHSQTGTMAISERPVIDATLLAVNEINEAGGLLGRPVEAVLADGQSEESVFAREAEKLIRQERVSALFGCWTSASRKAVVPVVERNDHLLFYPVQFEGLEESPNVVYCGPIPDQQILPALRWLVGFQGKRRWFLVGSDYVFPVTANAIIRDEAAARACQIVGEEYLPLGSANVAGLVQRIKDSKPDLIVNTINGDTNIAFFRALRSAGIRSRDIPTVSFSISEEELSALGQGEAAGDYAAASYFMCSDTPQNKEFLSRFARAYGDGRRVTDAMATAYTAVHLWAMAVNAAGSDDCRAVRQAVKGQEYESPKGDVRIDPSTLHSVQTARVGQVDDSGTLTEVYFSPRPIAPTPFPPSRTKSEWLSFLDALTRRWGGRWSNPVQQ
jgi:urea transport system substrate-binding protein